MTHGARRAVIILFVIMFALTAGNLIFSSGQVHHLAGVVRKQDAQARTQAATIARLNAAVALQRAQLLAGCDVAADLGGAPLPPSPRPSKLGVSIVADFRAQWLKLHCPGVLPPPSPGLVKWGPYYHKPVS